MVTDLGELLGSGLHVLDANGKTGERARLLAVGGSRSRLGEEDEVRSPAFGLVGRSLLGSVSNCIVASIGMLDSPRCRGHARNLAERS